MKPVLPALVLLWSSGLASAQTAPVGDKTVSSSVYDVILRMTKYAAAAYADNCPTPPNNSTVVQYFNNATTDTQATIFRDDIRKQLILALRGTSFSAQDIQTDFAATPVPINAIHTADCEGCTVHNGTQLAWNSVAFSVQSAMQAQLKQYPNYAPIVTGHSLGGALCSIASASLVHTFPKLRAYSFGQFRTGNPAYAAYVDKLLPYPNFYRVTHTNDGVPQIINASSNYAHHSTEFWELEPFGPGKTYHCHPGDDPECNQSTLGFGILGPNSSQGINQAHLCYSGILIGNPFDFGASACSAVPLFPQNCATGFT